MFWMIFSVFQKNWVLFGVFLVQPPMASVLLSALVERCFISRMRDFLNIVYLRKNTIGEFKTGQCGDLNTDINILKI